MRVPTANGRVHNEALFHNYEGEWLTLSNTLLVASSARCSRGGSRRSAKGGKSSGRVLQASTGGAPW